MENKLSIGVDAWRLKGVQAGLYRYISNVLKHWEPAMLAGRAEAITVYSPQPIDLTAKGLPENLVNKPLTPDTSMLLWQNLRLGPGTDDDVLWCPSYTRPLLARSRTVVTTHEAISARFPERFARSQRYFYNPLYGWSARNATLVVTDSQQAKEDIVQYWHVPEEKIRVVYMAATEAFHPIPDRGAVEDRCQQLIGSSDPFFLFVGKFSGRRSMPLLLEAFSEFKKKYRSTHKLALVGSNINNLDMAEMMSSFNLDGEIIFLYGLDDEGLNALYNGADAYVSSAAYEPVSLPVMEALATGCPVICLDQLGMREIAGDSARFIQQASVDEMACAMGDIANSYSLREELSEMGLKQSAGFSWEKCSSGILDTLVEATTLPR